MPKKMNDDYKVTIVMSVFNGEKFLEQQLQSLKTQTYKNWKLLVRNNGSNDKTLSILNDFKNKCKKGKVEIVNTVKKIHEVYNSFAMLVDKVDTNYIMLCDGDDFWLPRKIEDAVNAIIRMEKIHGFEIPLLYHTDLTLVDYNLSPISDSMWKSQHLNPKRKLAIQCLIHNHAVGNTFIFNKALKKKAKLRPKYLIMHDVFYLTIATLFGKVNYGNKSFIFYRQHENNVCGGEKFFTFTNLISKLNPGNIRASLMKKFKLAKEILNLHGDSMKSSDFKAFTDISKIPDSSWFLKRIYIVKHKAFMNGFLRNIGLLIFI